MTVAALPSSADYIEDGVTTDFPVPFRFKSANDLVVERIDDGTVIPLLLGGDYTVTGGETDAGGTVTRTLATIGAILRIRRETARSQPMVYTTGDRFPAVSHEEALDRQMLVAQEQDNAIGDVEGRALTVPPGERAPSLGPRASRTGGGKILAPHPVTGDIEVLDGSAFKGDPGGNVMAIGLFIGASSISIPIGTDRVQTSGYEAVGFGSAGYSYDPAVLVGTATSFVSSNGRGFRLNADDASPTDRGARGTGLSAAADQLGMQRVIADTQATGKYVAGIDASYWAHPQTAIKMPAGVFDARELNFTGNNQPFPSAGVIGDPGQTIIRVPDGFYAMKTDKRMNRAYLKGLNFVGGLGAYQSTYTGVNVNGDMVFEDCIFDNYTETAIGNNAVDAPYLNVHRCSFMSKAGVKAFGVAWGGYADGCVISESKFLRNYAHIKWGPYLSGSAHFVKNDMLRWDSTTPFLANFWFLPNDTDPNGVNSGNGFVITGTKFGNENMTAGDLRILIAKALAGNRQVSMPDLTWYPTGAFLSGLTIEKSRVAGNGQTAAPFCRSYIGQFRGVTWGESNKHDGGAHSVMCEFMGERPNDYTNMNHRVSLSAADGFPEGLPFKDGVVNGSALIGVQDDPDGLYGNQEMVALPPGAGDDASFVPLASANRAIQFTNFAPNGTYGGAAAVGVANHKGVVRAVEVTISGVGQGLYFPLGNSVAEGRQVRASIVLARSIANSAYAVNIYLENQATGKVKALYRRLILTANYNRVRLRFQIPKTPDKNAWQLKIESADFAAGANKFRVSEVYVYQGRDTVIDGDIRTLGDGKWDGQHFILGLTHIWEEGGSLYLKVNGAPTGPTDGKQLAVVP